MAEKKRDMDLIRATLLEIEAGREYFETQSDEVAVALGGSDLPGLSSEEADKLEYHLWLLDNSGMVKFTQPGEGWMADQITWQGHDFLDSVRDPEIWQKTKDGAKAAGGFTVELLGDLAKGFIKTQIKNRTGVEI